MRLFLLFAALLLVPVSTTAQEAGSYVEGTHYQRVSPVQRTRDPAKIEVVEFFWYGCGHCYNFEPVIQQWKKSMAEDVDFVPSPAMWNGPMEVHAQAYYTAQAMGVLDVMHDAMFAAINVDRNRLSGEDELAQLFTANGVDAEDFRKMFQSFGVSSQVRQASARGRGARITGTPELMVAGKYRIDTRMAGSQAEMLKVADFLIEKERAGKLGTDHFFLALKPLRYRQTLVGQEHRIE
jgi:thiol:disulfide interchange protein DsbA